MSKKEVLMNDSVDLTNENTMASASDENDNEESLAKTQYNFVHDVIKSIFESRYAEIFREPVDPVRDNVPDYFEIIKNPIDLSTILQNINDEDNKKYTSHEDIVDDFRLMINNCHAYNPENSLAYHHGKELEKIFNKKMAKLPLEISNKSTTTVNTSNKDNGTILHAVKRKAIANSPKKQTENKKTDSNKTSVCKPAKVKKVVDPVVVNPPQTVPRESIRIARKSMKQMSELNLEQNSFMSPALSFCLNAINELFHKKHNEYASPFLHPVDPLALCIPDYFDVIKHPMDLGTIRDRLKSGNYTCPSNFMRDVRLVFSNCFRYNSPETDVYAQGQRLQSVFEHYMSTCPAEMFHEIHLTEPVEDSICGGGSGGILRSSRRSTHIENRQLTETIQNFERKLQQVHDDVLKIKNEKQKFAVTSGNVTVENGQATKRTMLKHAQPQNKIPISTLLQSRTEPERLEDSDPMTYDEKLLLSTNIMSLGETKIKEILAIIGQREPWSRHLSMGKDKNEVVEIDLGSLAPSTLRAIEKYIQSANKRKGETLLRKKCTPQERTTRENDLRKRLEEMESQLSGKTPIALSKKITDINGADKLDESLTNRLSDSSSSSDISDEEFAKKYELKSNANSTASSMLPRGVPPLSNAATTITPHIPRTVLSERNSATNMSNPVPTSQNAPFKTVPPSNIPPPELSMGSPSVSNETFPPLKPNISSSTDKPSNIEQQNFKL